MTNNDEKILVTGGTGMVGSAVKSILGSRKNTVYVGSKDYDLTNAQATKRMFVEHQPTKVIHLAARVGGVQGNSLYIGDFCMENMLINAHVLKYSLECAKTTKVVSLLSTCVYPDTQYVKYPLTENQLHLGPPHSSNFGYAYAKRMLEVQSRAYNQQFAGTTKFVCAIPNNLIGKNDNFDIENGHVVPAIIRKVFDYKNNTKSTMPVFWGDGTSLREFTYAVDIAKALVFLINTDTKENVYNIGNTEEASIKTVIGWVFEAFNMHPSYEFDTAKPSGQFKKPSSNKKFLSEYEDTTQEAFSYIKTETAINEICEWYKEKYPHVRGVML